MYYMIANDELYHHGIKGQKWGVRKYQNPDGSLTSEGRRRYGFGERVANTGRKIRDFMTVKGEDGKRHLSSKGKKVVTGAAIGVGAAAATTGAVLLGKQYMKNQNIKKKLNMLVDAIDKEEPHVRKDVNEAINKLAKANNIGNKAVENSGSIANKRVIVNAAEEVQKQALNKRIGENKLAILNNNRMEANANLEYLRKHPFTNKIKF